MHVQAGAGGLAVPADVRTASDEDLPEAIRFIQTSTAKMDRLINAILRLSREGRREGGMVQVSIRDNGRGIAARDLERVFELFRRAGNQDRPGEGIGLAHVKALVRRLGGTIGCESTLGEGSVFSVRLPVVLMHAGSETT